MLVTCILDVPSSTLAWDTDYPASSSSRSSSVTTRKWQLRLYLYLYLFIPQPFQFIIHSTVKSVTDGHYIDNEHVEVIPAPEKYVRTPYLWSTDCTNRGLRFTP